MCQAASTHDVDTKVERDGGTSTCDVVLYKCDTCGLGYYCFPEARWLIDAETVMKAAMMLPPEIQAQISQSSESVYEKIVGDAKVETARERGDIAADVDLRNRDN